MNPSGLSAFGVACPPSFWRGLSAFGVACPPSFWRISMGLDFER